MFPNKSAFLVMRKCSWRRVTHTHTYRLDETNVSGREPI